MEDDEMYLALINKETKEVVKENGEIKLFKSYEDFYDYFIQHIGVMFIVIELIAESSFNEMGENIEF